MKIETINEGEICWTKFEDYSEDMFDELLPNLISR